MIKKILNFIQEIMSYELRAKSYSMFIFILFCLILPQTVLAVEPVARDISAKVIKDTQNSTLNTLKLEASDTDTGGILSYTLLSLPGHGQLKEETGTEAITTIPYLLSSNKIRYIPEANFTGPDSFTYKANDGISDSNTATVSLNIVEWFPPIGIPEPTFGIKETYRMYDDPAKRNPALTYTQNAEGGYYTHYVDNTHSAATDTSNTYGTVDRPRSTVPTNLAEGSVVEVHGGPYSYGSLSGSYRQVNFINNVGTQQRPIFIRGTRNSVPVFYQTGLRIITSSYLIIENIDLNYSVLNIVRYTTAPQSHHISFRNLEVHDSPPPISTVAIGIAFGQNVVVYNCYIHDNGDPNWPVENDFHAVGSSSLDNENPEYHWVVDNHMHGNGGDSFQVNSQSDNLARYIYVGRNVMHGEGENAIDLKESRDVVASENIAYGFTVGAGSDGTAIVVNEDSPHENIWVIYNKVYDSDHGIRFQAPANIIGNTVYNCPGSAMIGWGSNAVISIIGNTVHNVGRGIAWGGGANGNTWLNIENNILSNISGLYIYLERPYVAEDSTMNNNLLYNPNGPALLSWGRNTDDYTETLTQFQQRTGKGRGSIEANPLFVDAVNGNLDLSETSPAINAGVESEVYQRFFDLYGIDIKKDIDGKIRPQGSAWDIGAYEYIPQGALLYGDVSGDSEITAYDAALTAQASVGLITLTVEQTQMADVNGDTEVSAYDAAVIAQRAVGLIDKFPVEG